MKEAAGEANLTVITIILIAVVAAVVTPLVSNLLKSNSVKACCSGSGGVWYNNKCYEATGCNVGTDGKTSCSGNEYKPTC